MLAWKQCDQMTWKRLNKVAQNISILRGYFVIINDCHGLQKVAQLSKNFPIQSPCLIIDGCKTIIHNLFYNLAIFHLTKICWAWKQCDQMMGKSYPYFGARSQNSCLANTVKIYVHLSSILKPKNICIKPLWTPSNNHNNPCFKVLYFRKIWNFG